MSAPRTWLPQVVDTFDEAREVVEHLLEEARALAGLDHRHVKRREDAGMLAHRVGERRTALDGIVDVPDELALALRDGGTHEGDESAKEGTPDPKRSAS